MPVRAFWRIMQHYRQVFAIIILAGFAVFGLGKPTAAQAQSEDIAINVAAVILAEPGVETPFPIQIATGGALPKNSFIRIRGLPTSATLSEGHVVAPGSWAVPLSALPSLKLAAPITETGRSELTIALVGIDGKVWAETKASLAIISAAALPVERQTPPAQTNVAATGPAGAPPPALEAPSAGVQTVPGPRALAPLSPKDSERARRFVERGNEMMEDGDVAGARLFYQRAAEIGLAEGAIALAETYDPNELRRWPVRGLQGNIELAREWYERARELGAPEAEARLRRLTAR